MKLIQSFLTGASLFVASAVADYEIEDGVLVLGDETLAGAISEFPFLLVEFYAPWCGHCKQLAPEYAKAAGELEDKEDVKLAKVDATVHTESASKYEVSGYPTLKFFKNGEATDYNGGRTASDIVSWVVKKSGPSVSDVADAAAFESIKKEHQVVLALYTKDSSENNKVVKAYKKFADSLDSVFCTLITDAEVAKALEITAEDSITLFKQYDEGRVDYTDKITKTKLTAFVKPHLLPLVVEFSDDVVQNLFGGDVKEHLLFFRNDAASEDNVAIVDAMREVAKDHQGELIYVAVDGDVAANDRLAEFFGLSKADYPTTRIININGQPKKFVPQEGFTFTKEGFESFTSAYLKGELTPSLNSEDVPANWNDEALKVVVGKNFEEVVLDDKTSTLLMAHAPWCGHCKSLMPIFEELAEHYDDDENIIIAAMDATKNEVTQFSVTGFPTLKFFPSGGEMMDFEGDRELDSLIEFVEKNRGDASEASPEEIEEEDEEEEDRDEL